MHDLYISVLLLADAQPEDAGKYSLDIANDSGVAKADFGVNVKATPGKPGGPLGISDVSKNSCSLKWRAPRDTGGARVQKYVVEKREKGKPYWTPAADNIRDTEADIQGLVEGKEYEFRVCAVNENGEGEWLESDQSIIAKLPFGK